MANQEEVATHLDLSAKWVRKLIKDGSLPGGKGRGGYDLDLCRVAYIRYLRGLNSRQVALPLDPAIEDSFDLNKEKAKNLQADTQLKERKLESIDRTVAPIHLLGWVLSGVTTQMSAILGAIPQNVKRRVPHMTAAEILLIEKEIVKCQNLAAEVTVDLDEYEAAGGDT